MLTNRLCLAYAACALTNCVGTSVNQRRPLCGIGEVLAFTGRMGLTAINGGYTIFTEMILLTMQLTLDPTAGVDIAWPDDAFMCYVCTAKVSLFNHVHTGVSIESLGLHAADLENVARIFSLNVSVSVLQMAVELELDDNLRGAVFDTDSKHMIKHKLDFVAILEMDFQIFLMSCILIVFIVRIGCILAWPSYGVLDSSSIFSKD